SSTWSWPDCERPGRECAAEQRDELAAATHSITSSARATSVGGKSRPSALAVLRLMTSSYAALPVFLVITVRALPEAAHDPLAESQSSGSTCTSLWSWLLPTQNVTGVVELSTNTVRMFVSDGMRYCSTAPVFGSSRTTRSVCMVEAHSSPFLSKLARYGNV